MNTFVSIFFIFQVISLLSVIYIFCKIYIIPIIYKIKIANKYEYNKLLYVKDKVIEGTIKPNNKYDVINVKKYQLNRSLSEYRYEHKF